MDLLLKLFLEGMKAKPVHLCRIGRHDGNASRATEDNETIPLHGRKGEDLHRIDKRPEIFRPDDVRLFQRRLHNPIIVGKGGRMELCNLSRTLSDIGLVEEDGLGGRLGPPPSTLSSSLDTLQIKPDDFGLRVPGGDI